MSVSIVSMIVNMVTCGLLFVGFIYNRKVYANFLSIVNIQKQTIETQGNTISQLIQQVNEIKTDQQYMKKQVEKTQVVPEPDRKWNIIDS